MLEDGFTFGAFIDFLVRVIKAIGYANIVLLFFFFFDKWRREELLTFSSIDKFLCTFGAIDFIFRITHAFSGRMIATRYYFVEAILLIFPAAIGIVLLRRFICRKTSRSPILIMCLLLTVITVSQLASVFKPRPKKEYIQKFAETAKSLTEEVAYIYGDDSRINFYAGLKKRADARDARGIRNQLKEKPSWQSHNFFLALKGETIPKEYANVLSWRLVDEYFDYKKRKYTLWQGKVLSK